MFENIVIVKLIFRLILILVIAFYFAGCSVGGNSVKGDGGDSQLNILNIQVEKKHDPASVPVWVRRTPPDTTYKIYAKAKGNDYSASVEQGIDIVMTKLDFGRLIGSKRYSQSTGVNGHGITANLSAQMLEFIKGNIEVIDDWSMQGVFHTLSSFNRKKFQLELKDEFETAYSNLLRSTKQLKKPGFHLNNSWYSAAKYEVKKMQLLLKVASRSSSKKYVEQITERLAYAEKQVQVVQNNMRVFIKIKGRHARRFAAVIKKLLNEQGIGVQRYQKNTMVCLVETKTKIDKLFDNVVVNIQTDLKLIDRSVSKKVASINVSGSDFDSESAAIDSAISSFEEKVREQGIINVLRLSH